MKKKKNLENSIEEYQKLIKLNNLIEKKFQTTSKNISKKTKEKIKFYQKKMQKKLNKIAKDTNLFLS